MTQPSFFRIPILPLLFILAFITSCNGQSKTNLPQENSGKLQTSEIGQAKIIKAQNAGHGNVHCGLQDKAGNLWFGTTNEGVYRYNGKSFVNFTQKDGLNSNNIAAILEDKAGNIWLGTNAGLCKFDGKKFTTIPLGNYFNTTPTSNASAKIPPAKNAVWSIMQDKTGIIWFGTFDDGVYLYDGKTFTHFLHNNPVENKSNLQLKTITSIIEDRSGNVWFSTWFEGLSRFDGKSLTNFRPDNEVWHAGLLEDKNGNIWIGRRSKGVSLYDGKTFTNVLQHSTFDSCSVLPLLQDSKGNIWFGTIHSNLGRREKSGGLWRYDGKTFKNFTAADGLKNNAIWSAEEDKNGNIWLGANNTELYRYDGKTFTKFSE
ncbi:hypothetical protein I5M27_13875 [Adhaeribacter sp. BT258]|uniref:Two component regulator propeller n=1 Tax=Adhaeribacter terrigena TaxID=2793070 RepID=A0ABS1C3V4_9BACT|nr:two-component regulator propeller domain-containing protein [Adhaeribacter terrigena]MBK0404079.1 hypothetical protein [Adhaeribacter terrigena]